MSADGICYLCQGAALKTIEADFPPYRVVRCQTCDLFFVSPQPPKTQLIEAYGEDYYCPWHGQQAVARHALWRRRLRWLQKLGGSGPLLDVGCGDGGFLEAACEAGIEVRGTEFSPYAAAYIQRTLGIPVATGELQNLSLPDDAFNTITLWHSLEHTRDPLQVLRAARRLLRPSGLLVVAVPNARDVVFRWVYRLVKRHPPHLFSPADRELHLFGFTADSLRTILAQAGFERARVGPDHGQVLPSKRVLDWLATGVSSCLRRPWWNALLAYARKPDPAPTPAQAGSRG